ncbi:hypothetical protein CALCODRAFT_506158 [Calocera cornea HHB12733]|uniref:TPR-like protein n=1 Tax=Calocera cornea HHB12733 TaxID=1353952 RepID=A0A165JAT0_9BASI|nr:hypothetical protein CALCODRAFT_506158 [Calocera cornea HHB12733]
MTFGLVLTAYNLWVSRKPTVSGRPPLTRFGFAVGLICWPAVMVEYLAGDYRRAKSHFQAAITSDERALESWHGLAACLETGGAADRQAAMDTYNICVVLCDRDDNPALDRLRILRSISKNTSSNGEDEPFTSDMAVLPPIMASAREPGVLLPTIARVLGQVKGHFVFEATGTSCFHTKMNVRRLASHTVIMAWSRNLLQQWGPGCFFLHLYAKMGQ